jgi:D-xylonolactonase
MVYHIEVIASDNNRCGEAPLWDAAHGRLIWTDNETNTVYEIVPAGGTRRILSTGLMVAGIALNRDGRMVFAGCTGLHLWRGQDDCRTVVAELAGRQLLFNDIVADPRGRVYAGTLYWGSNGMERAGQLYLIDTNGSIRQVDDGIELSNGLGFSPDQSTLYYADSSIRRIYAYDVNPATGDLAHRRVFVQVPGDEGIPDGLTVDADGFVWSAQWYGAQVVRYDPEGKVERRIKMPCKQVSSVAFGGKDLNELYITSAGASWQSRYAPPGYDFGASDIGGSLYRVRLEIQGRLEHQAGLLLT